MRNNVLFFIYSEHMTQLEIDSPDNLYQRQEREFPNWFRQRVS